MILTISLLYTFQTYKINIFATGSAPRANVWGRTRRSIQGQNLRGKPTPWLARPAVKLHFSFRTAHRYNRLLSYPLSCDFCQANIEGS